MTCRYPIDADLAAMADATSGVSISDPLATRALVREVARSRAADVDLTGVDVRDELIAMTDGRAYVPIRVYRPRVVAADHGSGRPRLPAVLHIHGGGYFAGSVDSVHRTSVEVARSVGAVVVAVEYRLAPEHPFPAALNDCRGALEWLHDGADELGVDRARLAVHGSSAGGGLAAALTLQARDQGGPAICFQSLEAPALDDRLDTPSMRRFVDTPMSTRGDAATSWALYLGVPAPRDSVSPYAAPARATDLSNLPPAYVTVMDFDPLRDEGISYACALLEAGVSVELHLFAGTFHGSALATGAASSARQSDERIAVLRRALSE